LSHNHITSSEQNLTKISQFDPYQYYLLRVRFGRLELNHIATQAKFAFSKIGGADTRVTGSPGAASDEEN